MTNLVQMPLTQPLRNGQVAMEWELEKKRRKNGGKKSLEVLRDEFVRALKRTDLKTVRRCITENARCIDWQDENGNNAMHVAVRGFFSVQAPEIMRFLLKHTDVNLLHKNIAGRDPLDLAKSKRDTRAQELIYPYWCRQRDERYGLRPYVRMVVNNDDPDFPQPI